ncbi:probable cytosolic oligopeptidase A, partial [Tanacetum coccineum]
MATIISIARSFQRPLIYSTTKSSSSISNKHLRKSHICPLWSPSFFRCLSLRHRHAPLSRATNQSLSRAAAMSTATDDNPLLKEFEFPPFDSIDASHVRPGMRTLLKKLVTSIKEAVLSGVSLDDSKREEFNKIEQELTKLSRKFDENVLDATKKFEKLITDKKEIEGLPATSLGLAAQTASSKGHENATAENGPWMITLDAPSFMSVMQHAKNRALREEIYRAYISRASSGELDNTPVIEQILKLRLEKAKLLGYNNYAEVSMATKMATVSKAEELLEKLRSASWNAAVQDMEDLRQFAKSQGAPEADELTHWDTTFWSERLRESKYEINEEELRPYFSLPKVMEGLFSLVKMLFGIDVEPADGLAPVWNADVRFYRIKDSSGKPISYFYFDPYSRPAEKRGGAWMDEVVARSRILSDDKTSVRLPIAHMVCNQMPPVGEKPSLMTFREVETVFHEFGHALQHMLTKQDEGLVAGIRGIEWDAVELPSQFMENWCYHRDTLMSIAKHYETGESLPEEIYQKLLAARTFRAGSLSIRQFATVDLELHSKYVPGGSESIYDVDRRVSEKTQVIPPLPEDRFLCSFSHIFAGGYAAGYYSYKWAEVLSADAFSAFEDAGLHDDKAVRETGHRFRETILALGGGKDPLEVFVEFRGREPSPEPLLRHNGLRYDAASVFTIKPWSKDLMELCYMHVLLKNTRTVAIYHRSWAIKPGVVVSVIKLTVIYGCNACVIEEACEFVRLIRFLLTLRAMLKKLDHTLRRNDAELRVRSLQRSTSPLCKFSSAQTAPETVIIETLIRNATKRAIPLSIKKYLHASLGVDGGDGWWCWWVAMVMMGGGGGEWLWWVGTNGAIVYVLGTNGVIYLVKCSSVGSSTKQLRFNSKKGEFKILQVADMHFADGRKTPCEDVLPEQFAHCTDLNTSVFLTRMIQAEKPDLIVFTGDNIFGHDATDAVASLNAAFAPAIASGIPWAAVLGNHDQESTLRREGVMKYIVGMKHTMSQLNPSGFDVIDGFGNYNLEVHGVEGSSFMNKSILNLYFLDSGDYSTVPSIPGYGWIKPSQQFWFQQTSKKLQNSFKAPGLAYFHIPLREYAILDSSSFTGVKQEAGISSASVNSGFFSTLVEAGDVKSVFTGHDHLNDFCGNVAGIHLCYAGGFGYHAYGKAGWSRRARVVVASLEKGSHGDWGAVKSIKTWKRLDDKNLTAIDGQVLWME